MKKKILIDKIIKLYCPHCNEEWNGIECESCSFDPYGCPDY